MIFGLPDNMAHVLVEPSGTQELSLYLMPLPGGKPVCLNGVAGLIWLFAVAGEQDVAAAVAEILEIETVQINRDVSVFLTDLVGRGLVEVVAVNQATQQSNNPPC